MTFDEAEAHIANWIDEDGGLYCVNPYLSWKPGWQYITLDAKFEAKDLMAIAIYVEGYDEH